MDFACTTIDVTQLLKCSLGLSKSGCNVVKEFFLANRLTSEEIAEKTTYDLATVQRALKHLTERGVLLRNQVNREGGGYEYVYERVDDEAFMKLIEEVLDTWVVQAKEEVNGWLKNRKKQ